MTLLFALAVFASLLAWMRMAAPNARLGHLGLYAIVLGFEWLLLGIVLWRSEVGFSAYVPKTRHRARSLLWDVLTATLLSGVLLSISPIVISFLGKTGWTSTESMLPRGEIETVAWVVMAISAGVSEEAVFRGYLQRQISEWTGLSCLGIAGQAVIFGLCHAYQGWKNVFLIVVWGFIFGVAAFWRKGLRGNMIAHAALDIFSAF